MLKKSYTKTGNVCRVTFKLPPDVNAETAALCGDFNGWGASGDTFRRCVDGLWHAEIGCQPAGI